MRRAVAAVLVALLCPALAVADDHPITGAKLQLKRSNSGKQKLVFQSKDPTVPFPAKGGPDDPEIVGASIQIVTPGAPASESFSAPSNGTQPGWTKQYGAQGVLVAHKYKRAKELAATTTIKGIILKNARGFAVQGDAVGIPLDGVRGTVGIRITIGDQRMCARFTGASVTKDAVGTFIGKNATTDGLADCESTSLTGAAPTCGDGEINQPEEGCDSTCEFSPLECRPPGTANECTCCSDGFPSAAPCCNPSAVAIIYPPNDKVCVPTGCAPPDSCREGDTCRGDQSCCSTNGGNLCMQAYAPPFVNTMVPLVPCCAGLECRRAALPEGARCCASGGTSCAADGDCCTGHCTGGTCEACRAGGAGCGTASECCSGSCTSGTCDACAAAGTFCTSNVTCCSGTCAGFQCQP
jgi:hypothetical protein